MADDSSDLSSLSSLSAPPSEDEGSAQLGKRHGILKFFDKADRNLTLEADSPSPPRPKREPSPPHELTPEDNPDIALAVMFRSRFGDVFPKNLASFGPQELERDVSETVLGERAEHFLCALLSLLLNRKQDVKLGHYNRALEEAIHSHKNQWPREWGGKNPFVGGASFVTVDYKQRLTLLRALIHWALCSSEAIRAMISQQYKNRHDDDLNVPLSVQPWGSDGDKRRYFLVEGVDDTTFRVYRESNPAGVQRSWRSVAGNLDELNALATKLLAQDGGPKARALAKKINNSIPRFEATEEKRRRREYRQIRKEQFKRAEPGMSLYEGRTRGKRMKYTYSEDEGDFLSDSTARLSARNTRNHTPAEPSASVTTASGRQVRAPTRLNVENASGDTSTAASVQGDSIYRDADTTGGTTVNPSGRPRRSAALRHGTNGWNSKMRKTADDESDEDEESVPDLGDDEDEHIPVDDEEDEEEFDEDEMIDEDMFETKADSLVFKFPVWVTMDEGTKQFKLLPSPPISTMERKNPSITHCNIVLAEESEASDGTGALPASEVSGVEKSSVGEIAVAPIGSHASKSDNIVLDAPARDNHAEE